MAARSVILVSDKQARLKSCLRCGYSLRHLAGARNCPECGLAVRISLSGNSGLEWSSPGWQLRVDQLFWPLRSIVCDWLFPLSLTVMLGVTVGVLLRGARETDQNWI